jgi:hypothetical protein
MNIQDKEIDQLFKSELYDHEIEPAGRVWHHVAGTLDADKRKISVISYLSIAATVLIVLFAGWYFIPQVKVKATKPDQIAAKPNKIDTKIIVVTKEKPEVVNSPETEITTVSIAKLSSVKKDRSIRRSRIKQAVEAEKPELAALSNRERSVLSAVVPDTETPLAMASDVDEDLVFKTGASSLAALKKVQANNTMAAAPAKKRRINTLGDLINVVVSKVDKRKDKLIEFTSNDDDDATVTGINLGFLKIKKQD